MSKSVSPFESAAAEGLVGASGHPAEKRLGAPTAEDQLAWIPVFLDKLAEGLTVTDACKAANVHFTLVYTRRRKDPEFRKQWHDAAHVGTALLELEAERRAFHGTEKPVFYKGQQCGSIREYSDPVLMFLLRSRKPEVYRDGGDTGGKHPVSINIIINDHSDATATVSVPDTVAPPPEATPALTYRPATGASPNDATNQQRDHEGDHRLPKAAPVPRE